MGVLHPFQTAPRHCLPHLQDLSIPVLKSNWFLLQYQAAGTSKSRRAAILISKTIWFQAHDILMDDIGWFLFIKGQLEGQSLTESLYVPNAKQASCFNTALDTFSTFKDGEALLGGDLNLTADHVIDKTHKTTLCAISKCQNTKLPALLSKCGLTDGWRSDFTRHAIYTRIDYTLFS